MSRIISVLVSKIERKIEAVIEGHKLEVEANGGVWTKETAEYWTDEAVNDFLGAFMQEEAASLSR